MITDGNVKFRVNISREAYDNKGDASACLWRPGADAIGRNKMAFDEWMLTPTEFMDAITSGHTFCNLFSFNENEKYWLESGKGKYLSYPVYRYGDNKGAMKVSFKSDKFFVGSQVVSVDIDYTHYTDIGDYLATIDMKPTLLYPSYSDGKDKHGEVSRRFRMVYVFNRVLGADEFRTASAAIHNYIQTCTGELIEDNCGTRPSQYMNGVCQKDDIYLSNNIYYTWDFPEEMAYPVNNSEPFVDTEGDDRISISEEFLTDMKDMDYKTFMHYNSCRYRYFYRTERGDWERGIYQLTDDNYLQLWFYLERVQDGNHRRRRLFKNACLRRLMAPDVDAETLLFNLYVDRERFFDNSDEVITIDCLRKKAERAMKMTQEELVDYCSYDISYWIENRPMFIVKQGMNIGQREINLIGKEIRYNKIDEQYDPTKSVKENLANGIECSRATLYRYCNERHIDTRPNSGMTQAEMREQAKYEKNKKIELFKQIYNPGLSLRQNCDELERHGLFLSLNTVKTWAWKYYKDSLENADQPVLGGIATIDEENLNEMYINWNTGFAWPTFLQDMPPIN